MIEKPKLTAGQAYANEVYKHLAVATKPLTKAEICERLGWEYNKNNERRVREVISILAKRRAIIATSDQRGYKLAKTAEDVEEVKHQWAEIDGRIKELEERRTPLINFIERVR